MRTLFVLAGLTAMSSAWAQGVSVGRPDPPRDAFLEAVTRTARMVSDRQAQRLASARGLNVLNVTWEDTGRYKGSSVGPNISDMTIQVLTGDRGRRTAHAMPVIRFPNFSDTTSDIDATFFTILVGNERGRALQRVSLRDYLWDLRRFLSRPSSWAGRESSLLAPRDTHVLTSAQACFLPVPQRGKATFNPVLFNYQSEPGNPAVLAILATREGTSATIIENRDLGKGNVWGQPLFFNKNGQRASLTGERMSDFESPSGPLGSETPDQVSGLNMVLLIQVPLKYRERERPSFDVGAPGGAAESAPMGRGRRSDVEEAVIGHGALEGPFDEMRGQAIERDERFPIRVTVQFYKATSNGVVDALDMDGIRAQIDRVYQLGEYVGSLVTQGETGRPTEYWGVKVQPESWWEDFWRRYERMTGERREVAEPRLVSKLGRAYKRQRVTAIYVRDLLRKR